MRYETTTTLASDAALAAAERFFAGGFGLGVRLRDLQTLGLEGGGGHMAVNILGEHPTTREIETREWDAPVSECIEALPRQGIVHTDREYGWGSVDRPIRQKNL